ncbi:hypothetical protein D3C80_1476670 [compost metagenome]
MVVTGGDTGRSLQAPGDGRGNTPALDLDIVTTGGIGFVLHRIQAQGQVLLWQVLVDINGAAPQLVSTHGDGAGDGVIHLCRLAHQVDRAAGRTPTAIGRARTFDDFHRFDVERLMGHAPQVTHAINLDVCTGFKATNERTIAQRSATFARAQGNARGSAQHIGQRGCATLFDQGFIDDGDRLGRFKKGRGELWR